jgi:starvation-inducible DNA-binding protein
MSKAAVIKGLKQALADSYALYTKTQNFHWNVEGPNFRALHLLFEEQYTDLTLAIDEIAELIRALGEKTPGSWSAFAKLASIKEGKEESSATAMVKELAADQEKIRATLQKALEAAQKAGDEVVAGVMIARMQVHRKNQWMLQSSL